MLDRTRLLKLIKCDPELVHDFQNLHTLETRTRTTNKDKNGRSKAALPFEIETFQTSRKLLVTDEEEFACQAQELELFSNRNLDQCKTNRI